MNGNGERHTGKKKPREEPSRDEIRRPSETTEERHVKPKAKPRTIRPGQSPRRDERQAIRAEERQQRIVRQEAEGGESVSFESKVEQCTSALIKTARRTFTLDEGFLDIGYSLHKSIVAEPPSALLHLELFDITSLPRADIGKMVDLLKSRLARTVRLPSNIHVQVTAPSGPSRLATDVEIESAHRRFDKTGRRGLIPKRERNARFKQGPGSMIVLAESEKSGRKSQMEITEARAPLRARRLRFVQALLDSLPDIAEHDPTLASDPEMRLKTIAVANALSITGSQGLRKRRDEIFSARKKALSDQMAYLSVAEQGTNADAAADAAVKGRASYDRAIIAFDRALQNLALPNTESLENEEAEYALQEQLVMLSDVKFDVAQLPSQMPREEHEALLEYFRSHLRSFADSIVNNTPIARGGNIFRTFIGNVGRPEIAKRLLTASEKAAREGKRYVPEIQDVEEVPVERLPEPLVKMIETLFGQVQEFETERSGIAIDIDGLRSALRYGFWDDSRWPSARNLASAPENSFLKQNDYAGNASLVQKAADIQNHLATLKRSVETWRTTEELDRLSKSEGMAGTSFASIASRSEQIVSEIAQLHGDVTSLVEAVNNSEIMADVKKLADISRALFEHSNALTLQIDEARATGRMQTATELDIERAAASELLVKIAHAIDNEDWSLVREQAKTLPKELGFGE